MRFELEKIRKESVCLEFFIFFLWMSIPLIFCENACFYSIKHYFLHILSKNHICFSNSPNWNFWIITYFNFFFFIIPHWKASCTGKKNRKILNILTELEKFLNLEKKKQRTHCKINNKPLLFFFCFILFHYIKNKKKQ